MYKKILKKTLTITVLASLILASAACQGNANKGTENKESTQQSTTIDSSTSLEKTNVSSEVETSKNQPSGAQKIVNTKAQKERVFQFIVKDVVVAPMEEAGPVIEALGEPLDSYSAPSCLFDGEDTVYAYDGFEINTAELEGKEMIVGVFLLNDQVSASMDIKIGSTLEEVVEAFGKPDEENMGQMIWKSDQVVLTVVVLEDQVTSISYLANL